MMTPGGLKVWVLIVLIATASDCVNASSANRFCSGSRANDSQDSQPQILRRVIGQVLKYSIILLSFFLNLIRNDRPGETESMNHNSVTTTH